MRLLPASFRSAALILGVLAASPSGAEVSFHLRGRVPPMCAIEDQSAAPDGSVTLVELQINCNLSEFSLSAPDADLALDAYRLEGAGATPLVTDGGSRIAFAGLRPGRHYVKLRISGADATTQLSLGAP